MASVREIDVRNSRTLFICFHPGVLERSQTFAATVLKPAGATERQRLQRAAVDAYPNVQVFDVADIIAVVKRLVDNFVLAISFVGGFVILSGVLILIGSIVLTKSQRVYENAILKTLGAGRGKLAAMLIAEYGLLGLLAGLIGAGFASALSFSVSRFALDIEWELDPVLMFTGAAVTALVVLIVGTVSSFDVLFRNRSAHFGHSKTFMIFSGQLCERIFDVYEKLIFAGTETLIYPLAIASAFYLCTQRMIA